MNDDKYINSIDLIDNTIDEKRLNEIEKRYKATTQGEWWCNGKSVQVYPEDVKSKTAIANFIGGHHSDYNKQALKNAEFTAHAHQDIPELIAFIRTLLEYKNFDMHVYRDKHKMGAEGEFSAWWVKVLSQFTVECFYDSKAINYVTWDIKDDKFNKYSVIIQKHKDNTYTPDDKIAELEAEIVRLKQENQNLTIVIDEINERAQDEAWDRDTYD